MKVAYLGVTAILGLDGDGEGDWVERAESGGDGERKLSRSAGLKVTGREDIQVISWRFRRGWGLGCSPSDEMGGENGEGVYHAIHRGPKEVAVAVEDDDEGVGVGGRKEGERWER
jgi:hypothetical protein